MTLVTVPSNDKFPVQFKGSAFARKVLRLFGWEYAFLGLPQQQGVIIGYPHTSNWDFVLAVIAKWSLGVQVNFWGKGTLFKVPLLGAWLRWMGGIPVLRDAPHGLVGQAVRQLQDARADGRYCWFGLAPEGTRKYTAGWRSGFYQLALGADVPLLMLHIDYGKKLAKVTDFMRLTGDVQVDYAHMAKVYEGVQGFHVNQAAPIRPLPPRMTKTGDTQTTR